MDHLPGDDLGLLARAAEEDFRRCLAGCSTTPPRSGVDLDFIGKLLGLPRRVWGDDLKVGDEVRMNGEPWIVVDRDGTKVTFEPASRSDPT